jgi:hypothetical protein
VKTGDVAGAQRIILAELETQTGGAARAAGQTAAGQLDIFKNKLNDLQEVIGGILIPILGQLSQIGSAAIGKIAEVLSSPEVQAGMAAITAGLGALFGLLSEGDPEKRIAFFNTLAAVVGPQLAEKIALVTSGLIGLFGVLTGSEDGISRVRDALAGLFGAGAADAFIAAVQSIGVAIGEVVGFIGQFVSVQDVMIAGVIALSAVILSAAIPALVSLLAAAFPIVAAIAAIIAVVALARTAWENDWGGIQGIVAATWAVIQPILAELQAWLAVNIPAALEVIGPAFSSAWALVSDIATTVWPLIRPVLEKIGEMLGVILPLAARFFADDMGRQFAAVVTAIGLGGKAIDAFREAWDNMVKFMSNPLPNPFTAIKATIDGMISALERYLALLRGGVGTPNATPPGGSRDGTGSGAAAGGSRGGTPEPAESTAAQSTEPVAARTTQAASPISASTASAARTSSATTEPLSASTAIRSASFAPAGGAAPQTTIQVGPNIVRSQEDIHSVAYNVRRYSPAPAR